MDFNTYQEQSRVTAIYPDIGKNLVYPALGLAGETGEVVELIKKLIRDSNFTIDTDRREMLTKEMGDVPWYLAQLATECDISLNDVAKKNIEKLADRKARGVLHGRGNNR